MNAPQHVSEQIQSILLADEAGTASREPIPPCARNAAVPADPLEDLMGLGVLPARAAELVASIERSRNGFLCWAMLLDHTELSPQAAREFLTRWGHFPKWSAEVQEMRR